jgi:CRP/FNR family cyclic AMP-dependent transcriptional regulator
MTKVDGLGFLAAGLVLAAFCMKRLVPLRAIAITSNLTFILYGYWAAIEPVLVLHLILLPVNVVRLAQALTVPLSDSSPLPPADPARGKPR